MGKLNPGRGEFPFEAAGQKFRLVATAENLAALEVMSGSYGFRELILKLNGRSLHVIRSALMCMDDLAKDETEAAAKVAKLTIKDVLAAGIPIVQAISFQLGGPPGKPDAKG